MKNWMLSLLVAAGLAHIALVQGACALEIFRIGGEDEPRSNRPGVHFHQLQWSDSEDHAGLVEEALADGVLQPLFLTPEENIALTSVARGGGPYVRVSGVASYSVTGASKTMVDADPATFWEWVEGKQSNLSGQRYSESRRITMDLGGVFHVNRVRLFTSESGRYPDELDVSVDLGVQVKDSVSGYGAARVGGDLVFSLPENVQDTIDVSFPLALARSLGLLLYRVSTKAVKVAEVEIYGKGYINQAFYAGSFIDLEEPAIWGDIRWRGRKDPEARVWIQSRAGKDLDPDVYWRFTGRGNEISQFDEQGKSLDRRAYNRLKPGEAGGITYDTENWSFWSAPYAFADSSGTSILSPGPNSVFQLRVDFLPTVRDGGEVGFIEFSATKPPLAEEVVGEIYPAEVPLGQTAQLTYAIQPTIRAQHSGFDRIEIATPFGLAGVDAVRIGGVPVEFTVDSGGQDSSFFSIQLPRHLEAKDSGGVIEVVFRAPVLRYGTAFDGWVRDTSRPLELAQRINPGDAAKELLSETLTVRTSFSERLLDDLRVEPRTITPNGDGVNETVRFSFNVVQLTDEVPLSLEIFDLSGRRVRVLHEGLQQSGYFSFSWDGRDGNQDLMPPGIYVYRLEVEAEKGRDQQTGTVAVVY